MGSVRSHRIILNGLKRKGFTVLYGADHIVLSFVDQNGKIAHNVRTKLSHDSSGATIGAELIARMAKQCFLTTKQFLELVDCTMTAKEYCRILTEKGELD